MQQKEYLAELLTPQEIVEREFNSLRGRLLTALESTGMQPRQEKAIKTLVKGITYQIEDLVSEMTEVLDERGARFKYREGRLERQ